MTPWLVRAGLIGAATGGRSTLGISAVMITSPPGSRFARRGVRVGFALGAGTELVLDKLPQAQSRLRPAGIVSRIAASAVAAAVLASRDGGPSAAPLAAGVGVVAALAAAHAGLRWRTWASRRWQRDLPGAMIEDLIVLAAAAAATGTGGARAAGA